MDEFERIDEIRKILSREDDRVVVGIGDDAAVVRCDGEQIITVDVAVDRVHFDLRFMTREEVGRRAFMAAASDVLAMGGRPKHAVVGLVLPTALTDDELFAMVLGIRRAADECGVTVVGGNLSGGSELSMTTTVLGVAEGPILRRHGAQRGDVVSVSGPVGSAALGLAALSKGSDPGDARYAPFVATYRRPTLPIELAQELAALGATACIDISDGLLQDLGHILTASRVGATLHAAKVPTEAGFDEACSSLGLDRTEVLFGGGDDYVLLFTAERDSLAAQRGRIIGTITAEQSLRVEREDGSPLDVRASGFRHFR